MPDARSLYKMSGHQASGKKQVEKASSTYPPLSAQNRFVLSYCFFHAPVIHALAYYIPSLSPNSMYKEKAPMAITASRTAMS